MELPQHSPAPPSARPVGLFCLLEYRATGEEPLDFQAPDEVHYSGLVVGWAPGRSISVLRLDTSTPDKPDVIEFPWAGLRFDRGPGAPIWGRLVGWRFYGSYHQMNFARFADLARLRQYDWTSVVTFDDWFDLCRSIG